MTLQDHYSAFNVLSMVKKSSCDVTAGFHTQHNIAQNSSVDHPGSSSLQELWSKSEIQGCGTIYKEKCAIDLKGSKQTKMRTQKSLFGILNMLL